MLGLPSTAPPGDRRVAVGAGGPRPGCWRSWPARLRWWPDAGPGRRETSSKKRQPRRCPPVLKTTNVHRQPIPSIEVRGHAPGPSRPPSCAAVITKPCAAPRSCSGNQRAMIRATLRIRAGLARAEQEPHAPRASIRPVAAPVSAGEQRPPHDDPRQHAARAEPISPAAGRHLEQPVGDQKRAQHVAALPRGQAELLAGSPARAWPMQTRSRYNTSDSEQRKPSTAVADSGAAASSERLACDGGVSGRRSHGAAV